MSRNPTAATTNFANGANGISVGRGVDPADLAPHPASRNLVPPSLFSTTHDFAMTGPTPHGRTER